MKKNTVLILLLGVLLSTSSLWAGKNFRVKKVRAFTCDIIMDGPGDLMGPPNFTLFPNGKFKAVASEMERGEFVDVKYKGTYKWKGSKLKLSGKGFKETFYGLPGHKVVFARVKDYRTSVKVKGYLRRMLKKHNTAHGHGDITYCKF